MQPRLFYALLVLSSLDCFSCEKPPGPKKSSKSSRVSIPIGGKPVQEDDWSDPRRKHASRSYSNDVYSFDGFNDAGSYFGFDKHYGPYYAFKKRFYGPAPPPLLLSQMAMPFKMPCYGFHCRAEKGIIKYSMKKIVYPKRIKFKPYKKIVFVKSPPKVLLNLQNKWPSTYGTDWPGTGTYGPSYGSGLLSSYGPTYSPTPYDSYPSGDSTSVHDVDGSYDTQTGYAPASTYGQDQTSHYGLSADQSVTYEKANPSTYLDNTDYLSSSGKDSTTTSELSNPSQYSQDALVYAQQPISYNKDVFLPDLNYNDKAVAPKPETGKVLPDYGSSSYTGLENLMKRPTKGDEKLSGGQQGDDQKRDPYGPTYLPEDEEQSPPESEDQKQQYVPRKRPRAKGKRRRKKIRKCRKRH